MGPLLQEQVAGGSGDSLPPRLQTWGTFDVSIFPGANPFGVPVVSRTPQGNEVSFIRAVSPFMLFSVLSAPDAPTAKLMLGIQDSPEPADPADVYYHAVTKAYLQGFEEFIATSQHGMSTAIFFPSLFMLSSSEDYRLIEFQPEQPTIDNFGEVYNTSKGNKAAGMSAPTVKDNPHPAFDSVMALARMEIDFPPNPSGQPYFIDMLMSDLSSESQASPFWGEIPANGQTVQIEAAIVMSRSQAANPKPMFFQMSFNGFQEGANPRFLVKRGVVEFQHCPDVYDGS